jgi:ligand-binding sensor domain-containing protein
MQLPRIILYLSFLSCGWSRAQDLTTTPDLRFENFTTERNFISDYVGNITIDSKGYLWAASNGVSRFDGVRLQHYNNFNNQYHGLLSNYTDDLVTDPAGRLWLGNGFGLCYFNDTLGRFIYVHKDTAQRIRYAFAFLMEENEMWFASNLGLCKINLQTFAITTTSIKEFTDPIETFRIGNARLGISSRTGLFIYDIKTDTWKKNTYTYKGNPVRIRQCVMRNGIYWLATNHGLWQLDQDGEQTRLAHNTSLFNISNLAFHPLDKENKFIWLSTTNNGLQLYNTITNQVEYSFYHDKNNPNSLLSNNVTSIHFDKMNRLWLGTEKGVSMFDHRNQYWKIRQLNFREGITADNEIRKTVQDAIEKDKVWMSCVNQGILLIDWESKQVLKHYTNFPPEFSLTFQDMVLLPGRIWALLGKNKVLEWDPATGATRPDITIPSLPPLPVNREFTSFIQAGPDDIYITSNTGLYRFRSSSHTVTTVLQREGPAIFSHYDLQQGVIDKNGILWLASRNGLVSHDPVKKKTRVFYQPGPDSIMNNFLSQVAITGDSLVLCSSSRGINVFDITSETFSRIIEFGDIRNPDCYGIFVKDSAAWVNSTAGLLLINLATRTGRLIDIKQQINVFSPVAFGQVNEELVMGYRNMYAYFNPERITATDLPTNPLIEKILLNNQQLYIVPHPDQEYRFTNKQNTFSFYFTAFEFTNPNQIQFRYKLEGHDADWNYPEEQRNATYIRLPAGHYTFKLQAGNNVGQWNENTVVFHIYIVPPLWQRWWFWPLVALLFVLVVIAAARKRVRSIRKREEEKTAANKSIAGLETKLLRSQMNPHFIFNSLNSIQKYIWENKEEDAAEYLSKFAKLMRAILENSRKETVRLGEELDMMKLYVELEHRRSNGKFEYSIRTDPVIPAHDILIPPMLLQPFIENAIWHGLNKLVEPGHLLIDIRSQDGHLHCTIDDDGIGRAASARSSSSVTKQSLGTDITRQRVELLHRSSKQTADIRITDKEKDGKPAGTTVTVIIPLQYANNA